MYNFHLKIANVIMLKVVREREKWEKQNEVRLDEDWKRPKNLACLEVEIEIL